MNGKILSLDLFMVILIVMTTLSVIRLSNQSSAQVQTYMQYVLGTIPAFADSHNVSTGTKPIFSWPSGQYVGPLPSLPQPGSTRAIGSIASIQNDNSGKPE